MSEEITIEKDRREPSRPKTPWEENHGNLLLAFVGIVLLVGACILLYRQNRFVPPRFPDANMIETLEPAELDVGLEALSDKDRVTIVVTGAGSDVGSVKIAIYDSESSFNQPQFSMAATSVAILDGEAKWSIPLQELPAKIAVAAFHDENDDNELNLNRLGIPSERYGFSRNARGITGPPSFKQALISRPKKGETINVSIR